MSQSLPHRYLIRRISQLVATFGKTVYHPVFCNKCLNYAQASQRLFQLRHRITPFTLSLQRLTFQFPSHFSHDPPHSRQYQNGEKRQLPTQYN